MTDENMIRECALKGLSLSAGINPPTWVNEPKKTAYENPQPVVDMELYFELLDDLKNTRQDRNMFIAIDVLLLAACVYMSYLLGVW